MATKSCTNEMFPGVILTFFYDDINMNLTSLSYQNNGESDDKLRIDLISPYNRSLVINPRTGTTTINIPPGQQPRYSVDPDGMFTGISWMARYGD